MSAEQSPARPDDDHTVSVLTRTRAVCEQCSAVDLAVEQAMIAKFRNAGQVCIGANRLVLHNSIADEFLERFVKAASGIAPGSPFEEGTTMGPLISSAQRDRAVSMIRQFVAAGGEIRCGGSALKRRSTVSGTCRPSTARWAPAY